MEYKIKPFEELDIIDDYMASAAASDTKVGRDFARTLVQGLLQKELGNIRVNIQRAIVANMPTQRGIRLDIEVLEYDDDNIDAYPVNIYDIEPNKRKDIDIIKHNRFYQAKIDSRNLKSGEKDFIKLPNLFVMMITNYDPFGYDYMLYTVHNKCNEVPELEYDDGLCFLYFNTTGTKGGSDSLKKLLAYIQDSKASNVTDDATKKLHDYVSVVKDSPEARDEYMLLEEKLFYERRDGKEEGREEVNSFVVNNLLKKNTPIDEIAEILGITLEEVQRLAEEIKL